MIKYEDLPSAPPMDEREELIEQLRLLPEFEEDDTGEAMIENIRLGYMVLLFGDKVSITKEGYDYFNEVVKSGLN